MSWPCPAPWSITGRLLAAHPLPTCCIPCCGGTQSGGYSPTVAPFAWQRNKASLSCFIQNSCLQNSIQYPCVEARLWQHHQRKCILLCHFIIKIFPSTWNSKIANFLGWLPWLCSNCRKNRLISVNYWGKKNSPNCLQPKSLDKLGLKIKEPVVFGSLAQMWWVRKSLNV